MRNGDCRKPRNRLSAESDPFIPAYLREAVQPTASASSEKASSAGAKASTTRVEEGNVEEATNKMGVRNARFSYSFQPYQMITNPVPLTVGKKLKILFGTSQIEA